MSTYERKNLKVPTICTRSGRELASEEEESALMIDGEPVCVLALTDAERFTFYALHRRHGVVLTELAESPVDVSF